MRSATLPVPVSRIDPCVAIYASLARTTTVEQQMSLHTGPHVVRICLAHSPVMTYTHRIDISSVSERHGGR